jgi:hypothetical protein
MIKGKKVFMNTTFYAYSVELNLPTNDNVINDEVVAHDYTVTYDKMFKKNTFVAIEEVTGRKYLWECECDYDDLTEDDHIEMLEYRGIYPDETVATLEDWWMSQIKIRYVGYFN